MIKDFHAEKTNFVVLGCGPQQWWWYLHWATQLAQPLKLALPAKFDCVAQFQMLRFFFAVQTLTECSIDCWVAVPIPTVVHAVFFKKVISKIANFW